MANRRCDCRDAVTAIAALSATIVLAIGVSHAADPALVQQALESTFGNPNGNWAFTQTVVENGSERISRFDPSLPEDERWHLVSVEGRAPTEKEREREAERREANGRSEDAESSEAPYDGSRFMAEPENLSLLEETPAYAIYRFEPGAGDEAGFLGYIDTTMKIVKDGPYVSLVDMRSSEPFKPATGVKISEYTMEIRFEPVAEGGPYLPSSVTIRAIGRAWLVKKIDVLVAVSFTDYSLVEAEAASPD